jgi:uncharacterized protein (UPF0335 family)
MNNNQLQSIIDRIEKLEDDRALLAADIKEIFTEAKSNGFDVKIIRKVLAIRKKDAESRDIEQTLIDSYMAALGMLSDTPLGQAAISRAKGEQ